MLGEMQILDAAYHYCVYARSAHLFNFLPNNGKDYGRKTNYFGSSCQMEFFLNYCSIFVYPCFFYEGEHEYEAINPIIYLYY